jgi:hypothetical protein
MTIRKYIHAFMAKLGYVRAPAKTGATSIPLTIEIDTAQVREALPLLEQMTAAALAAEAALAKLWNIQAAMHCRSPNTGSGGADGSIEMLDELTEEIRSDQQARARSG